MPDDDGFKAGPYMEKFVLGLFSVVDKPVTFFREKIVEPLRGSEQPVYYHRKFRRVPTIDQCDVNDAVCIYEANQQFKRDKFVDNEILNILRHRRIECITFYGPDSDERCKKVAEEYEEAAGNWFMKYGDIGVAGTVKDAYMKQKHRLIWERRHGPVGSQGKDIDQAA